MFDIKDKKIADLTPQELLDLINEGPTTKQKYYDILAEWGANFSEDKLTYNIVYQLSIIENKSDQVIAFMFNTTKEKIKAFRRKNNLENTFLKRYINHPEFLKSFLIENGYEISDDLFDKIFKEILISRIKKKNWNINLFYKYLEEKEFEDLEKNKDYDITINNYTYKKNTKQSNKKLKGRKINQLKSNKSKIEAGKLGEKIVYNHEIKKLKELGFNNLNVIWITQTEEENVTLDGLGYDIISYNEKKEKIYIEVKTSITNHSNKIDFNISKKEVDLMNGDITGIKKENAFIYYVSNINQETLKAQITIIDYNNFSKFKLTPTNYKISEIPNE